MDATTSQQDVLDSLNRQYSDVCARIGETYCRQRQAEAQLKEYSAQLESLIEERDQVMANYAVARRDGCGDV